MPQDSDYQWFSGRGQDVLFIQSNASQVRRWQQIVIPASGENANVRSSLSTSLDGLLSGNGFPLIFGWFYLGERAQAVSLLQVREALEVRLRLQEHRLHCLEMLCISSGA